MTTLEDVRSVLGHAPTRAGAAQAAIPGAVAGAHAFTGVQTGAALALGVLSLLMSGLLPLLLPALAGEHRLSAAGIGQIATLETLSTAVTTGVAGALLRPRRLRLAGIVASLMLVAGNAATLGTGGLALMAVRTLVGVPEGLMLWIVVALIARTATPERGASLLFTAMAASQLVVAAVLAIAVLPRWGADGGYLVIAGCSLAGIGAAVLLPDSLGPLPGGVVTGAPSARGWLALFAALAFQAAVAGVGVYVAPLAAQAGLDVGVARIAIAAALACEVLGAALATVLAGRVHYSKIFAVGGLLLFAAWAVYAFKAPGWLFIGVTGLMGLCALLITPFTVPMTIDADPSRRAAVQIGGAQLLGGALGPLLASLVIDGGDAHGAVLLCAGVLLASLAIVAALGLGRIASGRA